MLPTCPPDEKLLAFHRGTLPADELDEVADHLELCPTCESAAQRFDSAANSADRLLVALRNQASVNPALPAGPDESSGPSPDDPKNWPIVPGYEVVGVLGQGGMGVVYKARQVRLGRFVAFKRLRVEARRDVSRSRTEAEALARLQHPGVVQIHEFIEHEGRAYLALELVPGGPLSARLAGKPQNPRISAALVESVARAVHFVHTHGIIHRDIKPANILLESTEHQPGEFGAVKIADFGIAKHLNPTSGATRDGDILGTPNYMAPEQAAGTVGGIGPASDIYSLGAVLYEMLTARVPLQGPTTLDTLVLVRTEEPVPPRRLQPGIPRDLEVICLKCLEKDPARRYQTAEKLADDLHRFLAQKPILARPTPAWERAWKAAKRHPAVAALSAALVLVAVIGFVLVAWQWRRAEEKAVDEAKARLDAQDKERQATRLLAGIALDRGITLCAANELDHGLLWLARSLELACQIGDTSLERAVRCNLAGWGDFLSEEHTKFPHKNWVWAVAISPDDRTVLTGSADGTARLWDAVTGAPRCDPITRKGHVWSVAFSPDGTKILVTADDHFYMQRPELWPDTIPRSGTVQLFDSRTGRALGPAWPYPTDQLWASFSPDGANVLIVGSKEADLRRVADGAPIGGPLKHPVPARHDPRLFPTLSGAFSPDGGIVATGGEDGTVQFWDSSTAQPSGVPIRAGGPVLALAFSPDGKSLLTGSDNGTARLWDVTTRQPRGPVWQHRGKVKAVAFSPDGQYAATGGEIEVVDSETGSRSEAGGEVRLWQTTSGRGLGTPLPHGAQVRSLAFSPDGRLLMTGARDAAARFFLVATGAQLGKHLPHEGTVQSVVFSHNGRFAVGASAGGNLSAAARLWTTPATHGPGAVFVSGGDLLGLEFHPSGRALLTWGSDKTVRELGLDGRPLDSAQPHPVGVKYAGYSPDGRYYALTRDDGIVQVWERGPRRLKYELHIRTTAIFLAVSPDSRMLVLGSLEGNVSTHRVETGEAIGAAVKIEGHLQSLAFHPDGKDLLMGTDAGAQLWDWGARRLLDQDPVPCQNAQFFPDGTRALVSAFGFLREWSLADQPSRPTRFHPEAGVDRSAISPDGQCVLVSESAIKFAQVWDVATGKLLGPAPSPVGARPVVFSPDGRLLAVGSRDGRISICATPSPIRGNPERIRTWAQAVTGLELDHEGVVMPLSPVARSERADHLRELGGPPLASTPLIDN